jgi:hypothetical protein
MNFIVLRYIFEGGHLEMDAMKEMLKESLNIGNAVILTFTNGKEQRGTVVSFEDTYLIVQTVEGHKRPVAYNLIGYFEVDSSLEMTNTTHSSEEQHAVSRVFSNEIFQIESMYSVAIKPRNILKQLNTNTDTRRRCESCMEIFDNAVRIREIAPTFNRVAPIINSMSELILNNRGNPELQKILCAMVLETGELSYAQTVNKFMSEIVSFKSCDDSTLIIMMGQLADITKNYDIVFFLAKQCQSNTNQNMIRLFIHMLHSKKASLDFSNKSELFSEENYTSLFCQINKEFSHSEIESNNLGRTGISDEVSPRYGGSSERIGIVKHYMPETGFGVIQDTLDQKQYRFVVYNSVVDEAVMQLLRDPRQQWRGEMLIFDKFLYKGKPAARNIRLANGSNVANSGSVTGTGHVNLRIGELLEPSSIPLSSTKPLISVQSAKTAKTAVRNRDASNADFKAAKNLFQTRMNDSESLRLYKKALETEEVFGNSFIIGNIITDMVQLYMRLEGKEEEQHSNRLEAERLLTGNKELFSEDKYFSILVQIYEKLGEREKLLTALDGVIAATSGKDSTNLHYIHRKATVLQQQNDVDLRDVVNTLNQWVQINDRIARRSPIEASKYESQKQTIVIQAAIYIAKIRLKYSDYVIPSPLNKAINSNADALRRMSEVPMENAGEHIIDADFQNIEDTMVNLDDRISPIGKKRLNDCILSGFPYVNSDLLDSNGDFAGDIEQALSEYKKISETIRLDSEKTRPKIKKYDRSGMYLVAAKMLYDALKADENGDINFERRNEAEAMFSECMGRSLVYMSDYIIGNPKLDIDIARLYYLESLKYLRIGSPIRKSVIIHMFELFLPRDSYIIRDEKEKLSSYAHLTKYLRKYELKDVKGFINMLLYYLDIMEGTFSESGSVTSAIVKIGGCINKGKISSYLGKILNDDSEMDMAGAINRVKDLYRQKKKEFIDSFFALRTFDFSVGWLTNAKDRLDRLNEFRQMMINIDADRYNKIVDLIVRTYKYNEINDYNDKYRELENILLDVDKLKKQIADQPSELAFVVMIEVVQAIEDKTRTMLTSLCDKYPPDILCELSGADEIRVDDNNDISVRVNVYNKSDCLPADCLSLIVQGGACYTVRSQEGGRSFLIKGGDSKTFQIVLRLNGAHTKEFSMDVIVRYQRKISDSEVKDESKCCKFDLKLCETLFEDVDNPYTKYSNSAIVDDKKMFFGRDKFIDDIVSLVINDDGSLMHGGCIVMYGQKRTGKSSILWHLKNRIKEKSPYSILVDIQDISSRATDRLNVTFPRLVCEAIKEALEKDRHKELLWTMQNRGISIPKISLKETPGNAREMLNDFLGSFSAFLNQRPLGNYYNVIILIDEFTVIYEWIQKKLINDDFMQMWKAIINNYQLVGILVGQDYMPNFIDAYPNPFGALKLHPISYLSSDASRQMITAPPVEKRLVFSGSAGEKAVRRIRDLTADSAYFNMIIMDKLVSCMNSKSRSCVSDADVDELLATEILSGNNAFSLSSFESLYKDDGDHSDPSRPCHNVALLWDIALKLSQYGRCKKEDIEISDKIMMEERLQDERIDQLINQLIKRDVIMRDADGGLRIKVGLFREWLYKNCSAGTISDLN